jgi:hypothetical protein
VNGWFNPDNWLDIVSQVLLLAGGLSIAIVPSWFAARTHGALKTETKVIRDQLVNGHSTMLRQDVDRALTAIETLTHEVVNLRKDLALEQDSRRSQIDDLRGDVDRMRRRS